MLWVQRFLRYVLLAVATMVLLIGIKACSNPTDTQSQADSAVTQTERIASTSGERKININSAILSELDKLEAQLGVPALSHKIQSSRPYGSTEELVSRQVITQDQYNQIKDQVTIEEIVLTGEARDIDYMTKLALMKGHMLVAQELLQLNQPKQAEPHLGHPVEEIYVDLEEQLAERNVPEFKSALTSVQDLVRSKPSDPTITAKFDQASAAIDQAITALPAEQRQAPEFAMQVINGLLETANAEYTAAIANGKIKEAIEYQDSRGFVIYAQDSILKDMADQRSAQANKTINATFTELRQAWPAPIPPATPVMTPDEVAAKVKQIEQAGANLVTARS